MLALDTWEGIEILSLRQFMVRLGHGREVHQADRRGEYLAAGANALREYERTGIAFA